MNAPARQPVAVLVKTFPKLSETFILGELLGLERAGFPLHVFALQRATDAITHAAVRELRAPVGYLDAVPPGAWLGVLRAPLAAPALLAATLRAPRGQRLRRLRAAVALATALRKAGLAHVHAHFIDEPGEVARLAARLAGVSFSLSAHAKDIYTSRPADLVPRLAAATFTVTCTGCNHGTLQALAPADAEVYRVYHGVDTAMFRPREAEPHRAAGAPRLLAIGRLRPKKGFGTLIEACGLLAARGRAFHLDLVGYGEGEAALRARVAELGIGAQVTFHGKLDRAGVLARFAAADVFVAPSEVAIDGDRDGIPNVLLEAMACGLPVVTTPVSGIPEVVTHGANGWLVPAGDATALSHALSALSGDPEQRAKLGAAARRTMEAQFRHDACLGDLVNLLDASVPASAALPEGVPAHG